MFVKVMAAIYKTIFTLLVFLYLFAYGIKFSSVPISIFLSIMSVIYLYCYKLMPIFFKIWVREIVLVLTVVLYLLYVEAIHGIAFSTGNYSFYVIRILIDGILPAYVLADIAKKAKVNFSDFVFVLVAILLIEFIFSSAMLIAPDFKSSIFAYVNEYNDQSVWMNEDLFFNRGFGIAYTYLAWFPFALALIFLFCLFSNVIQSKIFLPLLALATIILIVVNARIGFVPLLVGILIYLSVSSAQDIKKAAGVALTISLVLYALSFFDASDQIEARIEFFKKWVVDEGILSFFSQEGSGTVRDLSNFQILSDFSFLDFIFGRGDILIPENGDMYTDVGYMQTLYTGGLILSFSLYALFIFFIKRLIDVTRTLCAKGTIPQTFIYFPLVIGISFVIGHGKLRIFEINEATRLLLLVISFFMVLSEPNYGVAKLRYLNPKKKDNLESEKQVLLETLGRN